MVPLLAVIVNAAAVTDTEPLAEVIV